MFYSFVPAGSTCPSRVLPGRRPPLGAGSTPQPSPFSAIDTVGKTIPNPRRNARNSGIEGLLNIPAGSAELGGPDPDQGWMICGEQWDVEPMDRYRRDTTLFQVNT